MTSHQTVPRRGLGGSLADERRHDHLLSRYPIVLLAVIDTLGTLYGDANVTELTSGCSDYNCISSEIDAQKLVQARYLV